MVLHIVKSIAAPQEFSSEITLNGNEDDDA